jgi:hypothetical protein
LIFRFKCICNLVIARRFVVGYVPWRQTGDNQM